jgi:8-oxo-dGTP diphosphatase
VGAYSLCRDESGRVLLTRFAAPGHPDHGRWTMPGGGMEWLETPRETAARELLEETGLATTLGDVLGVFSRWFSADEAALGQAGHVVGIVFRATELRGRLRTEFDGLDTTDAAGWFRVEELDELPHVELVDFVVGLMSGEGLSDRAP